MITTWRTPTGWLEVRDALTIGPRDHEDEVTPHTRPPTDDDADHMLVRTVRCVEGKVEVELVCEPCFDYGREPAAWELVDGGRHAADASGAGQRFRLASDLALGVEGTRVRARHVLHNGRASRSARCPGPRASPSRPSVEEADARIRTTIGYWRNWLGNARTPDHRWREPLQRSALVVKGLTYMPTGATVAALTTSLPETPGGERNWDYRYTWMRDTTFTLQALHWLNLDWEADEFMQFVADLEPTEDGSLQIMYGIDGRRQLPESTRDDLSGYAGARPVRIGNGAFDQRQNDVFGAVLDSILLHTRKSQRLPRRLWPIVQSQAECATKVWQSPDQGIWEARGAPQHYVSSKIMCWVALDRAAKLAAIRGDAELSATWAATAEEIRNDVLEHGVSGRRRAAPALRDRLARRLGADGRQLRLPAAGRRAAAGDGRRDRARPERGRVRPALPDGRDRRRPVGQGGHVPDLLVLAGVGAGGGRRDPAGARHDGAVAARSARRSGLYAEEFDAATGQYLGNFPQAFSHLALIEAAARIIVPEILAQY